MSGLLQLIIADDEVFMRENLTQVIPWEELGYSVCAVCANGKEAFQAFIDHKAEVIMTDIQMPGLNGIELAKALRKQTPSPAIVFLSAYSDFEYARQGINYGVIDYLVKPVHYPELAELFTRLRTGILSARQATPTPKTPEELMLIKLSGYIRRSAAFSSIEACAKAVGLSSERLSELVRKHCGLTFGEFVYREKMLLASELLRNIGLQINTIAEMTGYANPKNFSRAFHNYYHMTPMEYRKQQSF